MDNQNFNPENIPELDPATANQLLDSVFAACDAAPSSIPVEQLESWGNYKKTEFRIGRIISYTILVLFVLLPLMFFKPTIIAQRTNVDSTDNAVYQIEIKTLIPLSGVSATLDGSPVSLERVNSKNYMTELEKNGTLEIQAISANGQTVVKTYEVSHLDTDKPELLNSYTEDGYVYLVVRDTYSGIDYENVTGTDSEGGKVAPVSYDADAETIAFELPKQTVNVSIPDKSGNVLQILLSPTE